MLLISLDKALEQMAMEGLNQMRLSLSTALTCPDDECTHCWFPAWRLDVTEFESLAAAFGGHALGCR